MIQVLPINPGQPFSANSTVNAGSVSSSSRDMLALTLNPSVTVSFSSQKKSEALSNITVPPVYTRLSVGSVIVNQLSPSRNQLTPLSSTTSDNSVAGFSSGGQSAAVNAEKSGDNKEEPEQVLSQEGRGGRSPVSDELSEQQLQQVEELKLRDQEVRAHEQAHKSAGGTLAGSVSLSYQTGPDGQRYAVGGEVPIDLSVVPGDPRATIERMNTVQAAATAPANPSSQDLSVAAAAARILAQAVAELSAENRQTLSTQEKNKGDSETENRSKNERRTDAITNYAEIESLVDSKNNQFEEIV